jgi:hypothetical protein
MAPSEEEALKNRIDTIKEESNEHSSELINTKHANTYNDQISSLDSPDAVKNPFPTSRKSVFAEKPIFRLKAVPLNFSIESYKNTEEDSSSAIAYGEHYLSGVNDDQTKRETPMNIEIDKSTLEGGFKKKYMGPKVHVTISHNHCKPSQIEQAADEDEAKSTSSKKPLAKNRQVQNKSPSKSLAMHAKAHFSPSPDLSPTSYSPNANPQSSVASPSKVISHSFSSLAAHHSSQHSPQKTPSPILKKRLQNSVYTPTCQNSPLSVCSLTQLQTNMDNHRLQVWKEMDRGRFDAIMAEYREYMHKTGLDTSRHKHGEETQRVLKKKPPVAKKREDAMDSNSESGQNSKSSDFIMPKHSDAFRTNIDINHSSTLLKTVRRDRQYTEKINRLRLTIEKKAKNLNFIPYMKMVFLVALAMIASTILLKYLHDKSFSSSVTSMLNLNLISNALRVSGFHYKECMRRDLYMEFRPSTRNYFASSFINWPGLLLAHLIVKGNMITISQVMNKKRIMWGQGEDSSLPRPSGDYSLMVYTAHYINTALKLRTYPYKDSSLVMPGNAKIWNNLRYYSNSIFIGTLEVYEDGLKDIELEMERIRIYLWGGIGGVIGGLTLIGKNRVI